MSRLTKILLCVVVLLFLGLLTVLNIGYSMVTGLETRVKSLETQQSKVVNTKVVDIVPLQKDMESIRQDHDVLESRLNKLILDHNAVVDFCNNIDKKIWQAIKISRGGSGD